LLFYLIVGLEPTVNCSKGNRVTITLYRTYYDVLLLLRHELLIHIIQHTTYLLPAGYSVVLHDSCNASRQFHKPLILHISPWLQHLGQMHYPFSYQLTDWFCSEVSTTCYSLYACVTLRRLSIQFFPLHQLHCYNHRSYQ
jgi:hypothetical protein